VACADELRQRACLFAVNTRMDPVVLSLDLADLSDGFAPLRAEAVCDTRDRRQPDAMNHWTATERIRTVRLHVTGNTVTLPALSVSAVECGPR
jgi:hypothetical protein